MCECKLAEKLLELRTAKGVTQDDVAQSLSVSNKTVSKWENGSSAPDLDTLIALASYYGVTTDCLLGISDERRTDSVQERMSAEFSGMDRKDAVLKAFETVTSVIPAAFDIFNANKDDEYDKIKMFPEADSHFTRSMIATNEFFNFIVCSEDVNAAVMLLCNESAFAWMKEPDCQKRIIEIFRILSDADALSVLYFINSDNCGTNFTVDYVSKNTGVDEAKITEILDELCNVGNCSRLTAHLDEGEINVYECYGDGMILSLISLAYEWTCGRKAYNYFYNGESKMIRG